MPGQYPPALPGNERAAPPSGIRARLCLLLTVTLVPILLLQAWIYYNSYQTQRTQELQSQLEVATAVGGAMEGFVQDVLRQQAVLGTALLTHAYTTHQANALLTQSVRQYASLHSMFWASPSGRILAISNAVGIGTEIRDREFFQAILRGRSPVVSDLLPVGRITGRPTFIIAQAIRDPQGRLRGVIGASVDPTRLGKRALRLQRPQQGAYIIFDRQGVVVFRYPDVPLTWEQRIAWKAQDPLLAAALRGKTQLGRTHSLIERNRRLAARVPINSLGWVAGAGRPEALALAPVRRGMVRDALLLLLVDGFALLAALGIAQGISRPLRRLQQEAEGLGHGEVPAMPSSTADGPREIVDLHATVVQMARDLQQQAGQVQQHVAEMEATLNSIADGLMIYTPDLQLRRINPSAEAIFTATTAEFGLSLDERLQYLRGCHPDGRPLSREETPTWRALQGETVHDEQVVLHRCDGRCVWVDVSAAPIYTHNGTLLGAVTTFRDITRLHELQEQQRVVVHLVSHDLRAPLTIIHGFIQLLEDEVRTAGGRKAIEAMQRACKRMDVMIQDLVDAARLEGKQMPISCAPLDLAQATAELFLDAAGVLEPARLHVQIPAELPRVLVDPHALQRILTNLLTNAQKYSEPGTPVLVQAHPRDGEMVVSVTDQGCGIAQTEHAHLFELFYRATGARKAEGIGLGLYITRLLVEAHGGRIWVESTPGHGSTFAFTLPFAPVADVDQVPAPS